MSAPKLTFFHRFKSGNRAVIRIKLDRITSGPTSTRVIWDRAQTPGDWGEYIPWTQGVVKEIEKKTGFPLTQIEALSCGFLNGG